MKNFLDLADFQRDEIADLLAFADRLRERPEPSALSGKVLGLLFFNPSLRTLASMRVAMARLGGESIVVTPGAGSWNLETRSGVTMTGPAAEHIRDAIEIDGRFVAARVRFVGQLARSGRGRPDDRAEA